MVAISWEQVIFAVAEDMPKVFVADIGWFWFFFLLPHPFPPCSKKGNQCVVDKHFAVFNEEKVSYYRQ